LPGKHATEEGKNVHLGDVEVKTSNKQFRVGQRGHKWL